MADAGEEAVVSEEVEQVKDSGWRYGRFTVIPSILGISLWLYMLDLLNLDVWCAERMAHFINLVAERVN